MLTLSDLRPTLIARPVRLEPLTEDHRAGLARADNHRDLFGHHMYFSARSTILRRRGV